MSEYQDHLYAAIYCGGGGTRLWPFSREDRPKQFLKIKGTKSLLRETFERISPAVPIKKIYLVIVPGYEDEVAKEIPEIPKRQVIVEPARRNTAMAMGLAASVISKNDKDAVIANIWADQIIPEEKAYREAVLSAATYAYKEKSLITLGAKPQYPHTGLGYIQKGELIAKSGNSKVYELIKFVEKPDLDTAQRMLKTNDYLWNIGTFVWRVDTFMEEMEKASPQIYARLVEIKKALRWFWGWGRVVKEYQKAEDIAIDPALAEKTKNIVVIEGEFGFVDLGSFSVLWDVNKKDENGNALLTQKGGEWIGLNTKNSMVISEDERLIGTYGVENLVIVATKDAVLVTTKDQSQYVKKIVEEIKKDKTKKKFL